MASSSPATLKQANGVSSYNKLCSNSIRELLIETFLRQNLSQGVEFLYVFD